jgi:alkylation response protein AidB-like acyl-CoA dehydrogenase
MLSAEEQALADSVRRLLANLCPTTVVRALHDDPTDPAQEPLWRAVADAGLFGLALSSEQGGQDGGLLELGIAYREFGRVLCPRVIASTGVAGVVIDRLGTDVQRERWLPEIAAGHLRAAVAIADATDGSDATSRLVAEPDGTDMRISGRLSFVADADNVDRLLVGAVAAGSAAPTVRCALIEPGVVGWSSRRLATMTGDVQCHVELDSVLVRDVDLVGGWEGVGAADLAWGRHAALALACMEMVGGAEAVLDRTVEYLKVRHQFGRPLASFQAVQHHIADMHIAIDGARLCGYQAVWMLSRDRPASRELAIAKLQCAAAYRRATLTAHQLHGGMGYVRESDLHLWSEHALATSLWGGADDIQLRHVAAALALEG